MLVPFVLASLFLQSASPIGQDERQPEAVSLAEAVREAYERVQSLRCTECERRMLPAEQRRVTYRQDRALRIEEFDREGKTVVREYRAFEGKAFLSSPQNDCGYRWQRINPEGGDWWPAFNTSGFSTVSVSAMARLADAIRSGKLIDGAWAVRLDGRGRMDDGTSVDRLMVDRDESDPRSHAPRYYETRTVYSVGTEDRLVHRIESRTHSLRFQGDAPRFDFRDVGAPNVTEFRGLTANEPVSDSAFRFVPKPSMLAVEQRPFVWEEGVPAARAGQAWREAVDALHSLAFASESITTETTSGPASETKTTRRRSLTRFDLARSGLARGDLTIGGGPATVTLMSDGTQVAVRGGHLREGTTADPRMGVALRVATLGFRKESVEMGFAAQWTLRTFFAPNEFSTLQIFDGFRSDVVRHEGNDTYEVLVRTTYGDDEWRVPNGRIVVERYLIGPQDHLLHGYEKDESWAEGDRRVVRKTRERFVSLLPDAKFDASRFRVPGGPLSTPDENVGRAPRRQAVRSTGWTPPIVGR